MIWTIFLILAVLKVMELITTSWVIIAFFGVVGFLFRVIYILFKVAKENR